ncbi:capsule assembly Wzi family protein [Mucilaginibacter corticis]|nr:capsule assembly Wzi family protein [Mucilaginibacter corticis]
MKKGLAVFNLCFITCVILHIRVSAQSLPVGTPVLDDYYRRQQLLGKVDSNLSFTLRPLTPISASGTNNLYIPEDSTRVHGYTSFANGAGVLQILPLSWQQQFNSDHPYGWNDEAMIPAKGYQTMISGGFYLKYGFLSIQFRPEFVYAANPNFTGFATDHSNADLALYYLYHNYIDQPERYGNSAYKKAFLGQSNITLTFGGIALGLSNESIWWGPGIRNALILSDNAPGFKHVTLNTTHPLKTFLGSFEGQIIGAKLENSGLAPLSVTSTSTGTNLYKPKRDDWRYYSGFNINYHPKWIPGLTLGLTRVFNAYHSDVKGLNGYVPFFTPYSKTDTAGSDKFGRDQLTSLYARWLFTKAQAEVYFEYGLNDNSFNIADFIGSPEHSRAYIFGVRKMITINDAKDQHILFSTEITQLSQTVDRSVRQAGGWYVHSQVRAGQTNLGQILGAGTGSGGNLQSMDVSWVSGLKKFGIQAERYEHDVDFTQQYLPNINGNSRNWVDFAFALVGEWNYKNFIFNAKLQEIKSLNYEWVLKDYNPGQYYIPHNDVYNFHGELGISYRF